MKKNDWFLLGAVAAYSYLFYSQAPGINFLIFTILLLVLLVLQTPKEVIKNWNWRIVAAASLLTAINVVLVNSGISILANILSLLLLAGYSKVPQGSIFMVAVHAVYSVVGAFLLSVIRRFNAPANKHSTVVSFSAFNPQQLTMVGIPSVIFLLFLLMYRNASAAFDHVLSLIQLDFISWSWIWFTFTGLWLMVGFFRPIVMEDLVIKDAEAPNTLTRVRTRIAGTFKRLGLKYEYRTSYLLLVMLNALILVFNLSDAYYLTLGKLPADVSFSEYLHQGVNTLIFSILMAIGILLYAFRQNLNFYKANKPLKMLAYLWLAQNLILVLITLSKNSIYISGTGLTYKRIGVYVYLSLTIIGLIFSYIKIAKLKTNWYLFRKNAWAVYLTLILMSCINWDRVITDYNLAYAQQIDLDYLFRLSHSNTGQLYQFSVTSPQSFNDSQKQTVEFFRANFLHETAQREWQSWNYNDWRVRQELQ